MTACFEQWDKMMEFCFFLWFGRWIHGGNTWSLAIAFWGLPLFYAFAFGTRTGRLGAIFGVWISVSRGSCNIELQQGVANAWMMAEACSRQLLDLVQVRRRCIYSRWVAQHALNLCAWWLTWDMRLWCHYKHEVTFHTLLFNIEATNRLHFQPPETARFNRVSRV